MSDKHTGSCLCGKVQLEVNEYDRDVVGCHCTQCRKQTGHYVAAFRIKDVDFTVTGEEHLKWYAASAEAKRGFCRHCASTLFWKRNGTDTTSVMAGCMDNPTNLKLISHIYTADKGDYYELNDGLPQYKRSD